MKKFFAMAILCATAAYAWIPGVCDVGDAKKDGFGKAYDYMIMKELVEGSSQNIPVSGYNDRVTWSACYVGALACYFGKDPEKLEKASSDELEKAREKATKLANKCFEKSK